MQSSTNNSGRGGIRVGVDESLGWALLWEQLFGLFLAQADLVNGISAVLEGHVVAVYVRRQKDLCRSCKRRLSTAVTVQITYLGSK